MLGAAALCLGARPAQALGVDVLDHHRACLGPVGLPQLRAVDIVVGIEVEVVAHYCVREDIIAHPAGVDVLDHHRACLGPVALPQLPAVGSVIAIEVEGVAHDCKGVSCGIRLSPHINERHEHHRA